MTNDHFKEALASLRESIDASLQVGISGEQATKSLAVLQIIRNTTTALDALCDQLQGLLESGDPALMHMASDQGVLKTYTFLAPWIQHVLDIQDVVDRYDAEMN